MPDARMMARLKWSFVLLFAFVIGCFVIYFAVDFLLTRSTGG
jgi:preprotein translocase subunit SecE